MDSRERDLRLWDLTRKLTAMMIPYNPPPKESAMRNMQENNPKGYACIMEYIALMEEEREEKEKTNG
jgi:hypothetical protein